MTLRGAPFLNRLVAAGVTAMGCVANTFVLSLVKKIKGDERLPVASKGGKA